jgi:hypothetical protein
MPRPHISTILTGRRQRLAAGRARDSYGQAAANPEISMPKPLLLFPALSLILAAPAAAAMLPQFDAACGGMMEVHEEGGAVFINGKEAKLAKQDDGSYQATRGGTTVSISVHRDGSLSVSYTGKKGAGGDCNITR